MCGTVRTGVHEKTMKTELKSRKNVAITITFIVYIYFVGQNLKESSIDSTPIECYICLFYFIVFFKFWYPLHATTRVCTYVEGTDGITMVKKYSKLLFLIVLIYRLISINVY